jgi:hypothetical protein
MPKSHPPTVLFTTYTPKTLEPFSGLDGGRILLAINGKVFDVTAGRNFYGPGIDLGMIVCFVCSIIGVQTACMETSLDATLAVEWRSNLSTLVRHLGNGLV